MTAVGGYLTTHTISHHHSHLPTPASPNHSNSFHAPLAPAKHDVGEKVGEPEAQSGKTKGNFSA